MKKSIPREIQYCKEEKGPQNHDDRLVAGVAVAGDLAVAARPEEARQAVGDPVVADPAAAAPVGVDRAIEDLAVAVDGQVVEVVVVVVQAEEADPVVEKEAAVDQKVVDQAVVGQAVVDQVVRAAAPAVAAEPIELQQGQVWLLVEPLEQELQSLRLGVDLVALRRTQLDHRTQLETPPQPLIRLATPPRLLILLEIQLELRIQLATPPQHRTQLATPLQPLILPEIRREPRTRLVIPLHLHILPETRLELHTPQVIPLQLLILPEIRLGPHTRLVTLPHLHTLLDTPLEVFIRRVAYHMAHTLADQPITLTQPPPTHQCQAQVDTHLAEWPRRTQQAMVESRLRTILVRLPVSSHTRKRQNLKRLSKLSNSPSQDTPYGRHTKNSRKAKRSLSRFRLQCSPTEGATSRATKATAMEAGTMAAMVVMEGTTEDIMAVTMAGMRCQILMEGARSSRRS